MPDEEVTESDPFNEDGEQEEGGGAPAAAGGAEPATDDDDEWTVDDQLLAAATGGEADQMRTLLIPHDASAAPNKLNHLLCRVCETAKVSAGHVDCVKLLLEKGADPSAAGEDHRPRRHCATIKRPLYSGGERGMSRIGPSHPERTESS